MHGMRLPTIFEYWGEEYPPEVPRGKIAPPPSGKSSFSERGGRKAILVIFHVYDNQNSLN